MLTVLIDYAAGNLHSAEKAFQRMAAEVDGGEVIVSGRAEDVARADRIVLPGDGAFPACMAELTGQSGLHAALVEAVEVKGRPFLGICVGMQLMATRGLEHGVHEGFGWIPGEVVALDPHDPAVSGPEGALKVPHMGWNALNLRDRTHPLVAGLGDSPYVYFVHSYHLRPADDIHLLATVDYGGPVTAMVGRDNLAGTQFHPEKSQSVGLRLLANFLRWRP